MASTPLFFHDPGKRKAEPAPLPPAPKTISRPQAQKPAVKPPAPSESGLPPALRKPPGLTDVALKPLPSLLGAPSFSELYEKAVQAIGLAPSDPTKRGHYVGKLVAEIGKAVPESADFFSSPFGVALMIGLQVPQLKTISASIGVYAGILQAFKTIPSVSKALAHPEDPVAVADAFKDIAFTGALVAGGRAMVKKAGRPKTAEASARFLMENVLKQLPPEEKVKIVESLSQPKTPSDLFRKWAYGGYIRKNLSAALGVNKPELLQYSQYLVKDREAFLATEYYKVDWFVHYFKKMVPKEDRDVTKLGFVLQGTHTADEVGLGPEARKFVDFIRQVERYRADMIREVYGPNARLWDVETYLTQIWDIPNVRQYTGRVSGRLSRDPFMRERTVLSYAEGIAQGLKPRYRDVADIINIRHKHAVTVMANKKLANWLAQVGFIISEPEAARLGLHHWKRAPDDFNLRMSVSRSKNEAFAPQVRVHPDVEQAIDAIYGERIKFPPFYAFDTFRSHGKQLAVMYSLFHHWALSEGAHALYLFRDPKKVITETFLFNKRFYKGLVSGIWEVTTGRTKYDPPVIAMKPEATLEWLKAGLSIRASDAETTFVEWLRKRPERSSILGRMVNAPMRWFGNVAYIFNRSLWDFYMQGGMLLSAETVFAKEMAARQRQLGRVLNAAEIEDLRKAVADHINRVWGSENLETLLMTPKFRQIANWILFAPLWTLSNLRVITAGFENETAVRLTAKYLAGATIAWTLMTQLANYATTSWFNSPDKYGRKGGHFTWDNPGVPLRMGNKYVYGLTENSVNIFAGYNPDGSETYIRFGKGYREPFLWILEPFETFFGKISIPMRVGMTAATGSQPGTMYQVISERMPKEAVEMQRLSLLMELFLPFVAEDIHDRLMRKMYPQYFPESTVRTQVFGLPTRKGINVRRAAEEYEKAIDLGEPEMAQKVLETAAMNRIHPYRVIREYRARQRQRIKTYLGLPRHYSPSGELIEEK